MRMEKILIVDDEEMIREGLKTSLENEGYQTETASNGTEVPGIIQSFGPQLIISDIIMPEMDGIEVIIEIKKRFQKIKIIAISGGGRISADNHLNIAKKLGADAILTKPFSMRELKETITQLEK